MINAFIATFTTGIGGEIVRSAFRLAPIWVPLVLLLAWWDTWMHRKQREWIREQGSALIEVRIPREILKSPEAMEVFMNVFAQAGVGNLLDVYMKGRVRPHFSLELVSIDGTVHFYIWSNAKLKNTIETQLYAVFPEVEVQEVPDYALGVHRDPEHLSIGWIGQFALTKADAYPIKTYIDYGLEKNPKEEYKIDPIVPVLEYLGSLKKGEQAWIQILIRAHAKEGLKHGRIVTRPDWKAGAEKEIQEIIKKATLKPQDEKQPKMIQLSETQKNVVNAIQRTLAKPAFDTMIRAAYLAEKPSFDPSKIGGLLGSFRQFSTGDLNGFKPDFNAGKNEYPWQDFGGRKKAKWERQLLEAYKRRSFFYPPFKNFHGRPFILTTEELATLWHFPSGTVAATPTLTRIPSKKAEAPANLPV